MVSTRSQKKELIEEMNEPLKPLIRKRKREVDVTSVATQTETAVLEKRRNPNIGGLLVKTLVKMANDKMTKGVVKDTEEAEGGSESEAEGGSEIEEEGGLESDSEEIEDETEDEEEGSVDDELEDEINNLYDPEVKDISESIPKEERGEYLDKLRCVVEYQKNETPTLQMILDANLPMSLRSELMEKYFIWHSKENGTDEKAMDKKEIMKTLRENATSSKEEAALLGKELALLNSAVNAEKGFRYKILQSKMTLENKKVVWSRYQRYIDLSGSESERDNLRSWLEFVTSIPWGVYSNQKSGDTARVISEARKRLNEKVSFMDDIKEELLDLVALNLKKPSIRALALQGPPGVGKTRLVLEGVSQALGRPLRMISLGGAKDASVLKGNLGVWVGSTPGRIVEILKETGVMDPVIYFDELDKIADNGMAEISGVLTHLIDATQVSKFQDEYFPGLTFDLSRVTFVFSYNDPARVDSIVSDRMKKFVVSPLTNSQKVQICKRHIIPEIITKMGMNEKDIVISDATITSAVEMVTESGCREIGRLFETVLLRINRQLACGTIKKPVTITIETIRELNPKQNKEFLSFYT